MPSPDTRQEIFQHYSNSFLCPEIKQVPLQVPECHPEVIQSLRKLYEQNIINKMKIKEERLLFSNIQILWETVSGAVEDDFLFINFVT